MKLVEVRHTSNCYLLNVDQITYVHFAVDEDNANKVWAKVYFADPGNATGSNWLAFSGDDAIYLLRKLRELSDADAVRH